ncbi:hypothetical protein [Nostoc sp.]
MGLPGKTTDFASRLAIISAFLAPETGRWGFFGCSNCREAVWDADISSFFIEVWESCLDQTFKIAIAIAAVTTPPTEASTARRK